MKKRLAVVVSAFVLAQIAMPVNAGSVVVGAQPPGAQQSRDGSIALELGAGGLFSPDYRSLLEDVYPDYNLLLGGGWFQLSGGLRYRVNEQLSISPKVDVMLNYVIADGGREDESYLNYILVPGVNARFSFDKAPSLYVGGELTYNLPHTGSKYYELKSGGLGGGAFLGYVFQGDFFVELGYNYIPVEVGSEKKNLGGVLLRLGKAF